MDIREMLRFYQGKGLNRELSIARVCQDIILKAVADGPLNRNVTIKGGIVMRSITNDSRRATKDIDLDFIRYPLNEASIRIFVDKLNCVCGVKIELVGEIEELKHQDYKGKRVYVKISDTKGYSIESKIDIGVHKHFDIEQDEYCFDVCMDEMGVSLLRNTNEQAFTEKLRSLLKFGMASRRYKDIYDMYYLKDYVNFDKLQNIVKLLILDDEGMRETCSEDIVRRIASVFSDKMYLKRVAESRQRWIDEDVKDIADGIIMVLKKID